MTGRNYQVKPHRHISYSVNLDNKIVILIVDDVLHLAAGQSVLPLEALFDYGRPEKVELLTFVDRGHRNCPFMPSKYIGSCIETPKRSTR